MSKKYQDNSYALFKENLHGITENAVYPDHVNILNYEPRSLVDETLEIIDPTPNVYTMFVQFDQKFFWKKLTSVQVKWSKRMTSCAGVCSFRPGNKECIISLSEPLLKLRPRKDLVETLLHEMIHGYLFLTNNNRDRDGHGPEFCKHMRRINLAAGTNITIYHDFHDEVRLYQQHWWRCTGPCQKRGPFYGTVRRSVNRAPGPSDKWWSDHQRSCDGKFVKIREPDEKSVSKEKPKALPKLPANQNTLDNFILSPKNKIPSVKPAPQLGAVKKAIPATRIDNTPPEGFKKLGTGSNNVYGFGTGGPGSCPCKPVTGNGLPAKNPGQLNFTGTVGGSSTGRSNLLDRYSSPTSNATVTKEPEAQCPVCNQTLPEKDINAHLDNCLLAETQPPLPKRSKISGNDDSRGKKNLPTLEGDSSPHKCPVCSETISPDMINSHLDACLLREDNASSLPSRKSASDRGDGAVAQRSGINIIECISCHAYIRENDINSHLDMCLAFDDDFSEPIESSGNKNDYIECPTCNLKVKTANYIIHVDDCLKREYEKTENDNLPVVILDDDEFAFKKPQNSTDTYKCLVCNASIKKSIPLNQHLETCISEIYGDLSELDEPFDAPDEKSPTDEENFCPICKTMIKVTEMEAHVDHCIETFTPTE